MELTDEQVQSMTADEFLAHHGLSRDEPFADTGMTVDDFLMHYGVMGMHWGIRKGRGTTGISRTRGATIDRNKRYLHQIKLMKSGKKYRAQAAVGRALLGRDDFRRKMNQRVTNLNAQNDRLRNGKVTITDRLDMFSTITVADMLVSRTPNAQSTVWDNPRANGQGF